MNKIAPRSKCDQVVYEAIAKITEIIVRSRCEEGDLRPSDDSIGNSLEEHVTSDRISSRTSFSGGYNSSNHSSSSSARFNLEIEEVESIRKILLMWKRSLHVPLRLDIYYEYSLDGEATTRKELLERWVIDYMATNMDRRTIPNPKNDSALVDDSIAQLRQVCKRVMVMLRTLHTFIRLMPAFHLQQGLDLLQKRNNDIYFKNDCSYGRYGMQGHEAGYYYQKSHGEPERSDSSMKALRGRILFTFHASEADTVASDASFLSLNTPFSKRDLNSIPTPFGQLNLSVLYDSSLNIERVMAEASDRLSLRRSNAIPIHQNIVAPTHVRGFINDHQDTNIQSLPTSTGDNDLTHRHIIDDYAASPLLRSRSFSPHIPRTKILNKSRSSITDQSSYPEESCRFSSSSNNNNGHVLSGISLALMNEENSCGSQDQPYAPRAHANTGDEFILSKQRRAFHQPPPNMISSSVLQNSHGPMDQSFHSPSMYAYGYNHGRLINTKSMPIHITSTDKAVAETSMPMNTPPAPAFLGSTPRITGFPIPVALSDENTGATVTCSSIANSSEVASKIRSVSPPFRNPMELIDLKTRVSVENAFPSESNFLLEPKNTSNQTIDNSQHSNILLPPITSLDVLTLNPFLISSDRSATSSGLYFSAVTRHSHFQSANDDLMTEMPFAVHTCSSFKDFNTFANRQPADASLGLSKASKIGASPNLSASEVLTTLASRCVTASRLQTFDNLDDHVKDADAVERRMTVANNRSALQSELEKFRSFGLSLTTT